MSKVVLISLIFKYAALMGVDPYLALSVAKIESNFTSNAIGSVGEIGIFQIRPEYSYFSRAQLFDPVINVIEGIRKIKEAEKYCPHKKYFIVCYNVGVTGSKGVRRPASHPYVRRVYGVYNSATNKYSYLGE